MPDFEDLLRSIAMRPGMYVGRCSIRAVGHYLDGYCDALLDLGQDDPLDGWMRWVELRFLISNPAWHWTRILRHVYGDDGKALEALPDLHREFLAERTAIGVDGIEAALDRRLMEVHGEPWYEPPETHTTLDQ